MKKNSNLLNGNILYVFLNYLFPSIGGMLGTSLYVLADTIFVGRSLGSQGLAALNISIPVMNIFSGLGLLLGVGGATLVSIYKGKNKNNQTHTIFTYSIISCILIGVLITFLGLYYLNDIALFLGAKSKNILNMSKNYLQILISFSLFFILNSALVVFIRNDNAPKLSMIAMLSGTISNVILDYIFMFKFNLGIKGAAFATVLSPIISLSILSIHFITKKNTIKLATSKLDFNLLKRIISNGMPSLIVESMAGIIIFAFNNVILSIEGNLGVSAYSIIANLSLFCAAIFNGISQAIQPIISINYGACQNNRVHETVKLGIYTSLIFGLLFFIIGQLFPEQLSLMFMKKCDNVLVNLTTNGIRLYSISFIFMGLNSVMISYLQSMEFSKVSTFMSICRGFLMVLIGLLVFPRFFNLKGVWITLPFAEFTTFILSLIIYKECLFIIKYSLKWDIKN